MREGRGRSLDIRYFLSQHFILIWRYPCPVQPTVSTHCNLSPISVSLLAWLSAVAGREPGLVSLLCWPWSCQALDLGHVALHRPHSPVRQGGKLTFLITGLGTDVLEGTSYTVYCIVYRQLGDMGHLEWSRDYMLYDTLYVVQQGENMMGHCCDV